MVDDNFRHIVRIANTDLEGGKPVFLGMRKIKGIGFMFSNMILELAGIDGTKKSGELSDAEIKTIEKIIVDPLGNGAPSWMINRRKDYESGDDKHLIGADLKFQNENDVRRLMKTKSYRGGRLQVGLPVRGQKTKSNFRRNKGKGSLGVKRKKAKGGRV